MKGPALGGMAAISRGGCYIPCKATLPLIAIDTASEGAPEHMSNKIDLSGRNAVITGGAQGIGRAIVERFLDSGAAVAIWDRDLKLAQKTTAELKNRGRLSPVAVDVTKYADIERARDATLKEFGRIDILVNNAGIAGPNVKTWEYPLEAWRDVLSINLDGPFHCCRALAPTMIAQNYGRIVNIASIAGTE